MGSDKHTYSGIISTKKGRPLSMQTRNMHSGTDAQLDDLNMG